jgi:hypothetical protein
MDPSLDILSEKPTGESTMSRSVVTVRQQAVAPSTDLVCTGSRNGNSFFSISQNYEENVDDGAQASRNGWSKCHRSTETR